ncbi:Pkinase-domain-containing protein [Sistotremastrum niveocremeum HHB9708]|uniref:non-specific serine/threonine protein kinase n=2 Tax=Sistotremastraceae TaxID=3402574 RepID=A0A164YPZ6_9AGAM|nr:Pkinase-domain-containing protein [Sistotremastrum niveocremeum HHB9708]KZT41632.1 Pkinase-domain-containing protein [Sistotremastrum suecicum HHB10207 ss-3]
MSTPSSPSKALISLIPVGGSQNNEWRPIYQRSNAVVLYNSTSHALTIRHDVQPPSQPSLCPYCNQELPPGFVSDHDDMRDTLAPNYFHLLSVANEATSRPSSPVIDEKGRGFPTGVMAEGYFNTFFREEGRLGIGANGSVYLCQHVLNGNELGHFAVKKVAVGDSPEYLVNILSEVRLLETLQHPNIITYHHAWLESCRFSSFGPSIPTLHILMQWAEGGSLDDLIETRSGMKASHSVGGDESSGDLRTRSERIRAFRAKQHISAEERKRLRERNRDCTTAVHLFSAAEIKSLMSDIVSGLAFLHDKSILHLDLKPLNVLLTYDEGRLIPRAMLCDFGTSRDMLRSSSMRSGNTGTLEYCSPESIMQKSPRVFQPIDSKSDMWSLGMVLHKMLFFRLPFAHVQDSDIDGLEREILTYPGFKPSPEISGTIRRRMLPRAVIVLLESLLHVSPKARPTCEQVLAAIKDGKVSICPNNY